MGDGKGRPADVLARPGMDLAQDRGSFGLPMSHPSRQAVFLSYAREDSEPAARIASALRSHGIEVWFDQTELRGGDAWDQMIRRQIRECTLFVPLISANTQLRREGYFRLEWKLAVERSHLIVEGAPFLFPVFVDDTSEATGVLPEAFLRHQFARIPGGLPTPDFVAQVERLLARAQQEVPVGVSAPRAAAVPAAVPQAVAGAPATAARAAANRGGKFYAALAALVCLGALGAWLWVQRRAAPGPAPVAATAPSPAPDAAKSIAVLPFVNMSEEKDSQFFADGIHEDILTDLALIPQLKVISRTTVDRYRNTDKTLRQIGQELGVAYVLEGSVQRAGNRVRVTGQLIDARTDDHVWAKAYDRDLTDVFEIQSSLATDIASSLQAALSPQTKQLIARKPTDNPAAYEQFLRGRDIFNRSGIGLPGPLDQAEACFERAVQLDPGFAGAWGQIAINQALHAFWGMDTSPARLAKADEAIAHAVRIAPDDPEIIEDLGTYAYYGYRDYDRALEEYRKLARFRPNDATVVNSMGLIERREGHWPESLAHLKRALELDESNIGYLRSYEQSLEYCRRWDEAIAILRRLADLHLENGNDAEELASLAFRATGSWDERDRILAALPAAERNSPRVLWWRKQWAQDAGDFATYADLQARLPYFDDDGVPHAAQALDEAIMFAANGQEDVALRLINKFYADVRAGLAKEPANTRFMGRLAGMEALLGHKEEAQRLLQELLRIKPLSRDSVDGPIVIGGAAEIYAWTGDKERALEFLDEAMRIPGAFNEVRVLRYDPWLKPLRGDPRFEAILSDPKNSAPLF
jgi:TolB-like protein/tetratricopeptide (TPR) repeat protein